MSEMRGRLDRVFEPIKIGELTTKNRIEAAPTLPCIFAPDGYVSRELIDFYRARARGGAGIVTVGESAVDNRYAVTHAGQLLIHHDKVIPGLCDLAEAIKRYGAMASLELNHAGSQTLPHLIDGRDPIAPSPIPSRLHEEIAGRKIPIQEMTMEMIEEVTENFASAAERLKRAGFDMLMLHGGHGWLLAQFLSPYTNKRMDIYGGSLENRARFPIEVIKRIRERVGGGLAIEYRFSADELISGGLTQQEAVTFAMMIEDKVDCLHVSAGTIREIATSVHTVVPVYLPYAPNVPLAEKIKRAVSIPVTCVGAIMDLEMADKIIKDGKADLVAMARALIADPDLPIKSSRGQSNQIIPCVRCNECNGRVAQFLPVRCAVNPVTGRESEYTQIRAADKKKRVLVVGGGPAGLEAAIIAAKRGHHVTLYEKIERLGGNLFVAAVPAFKDDMKKLLHYLVNRVNELPVEVKLNTEATPEAVKEANPDVLILAVGAEPLIPDIPGISRPGVVWAGDVITGQVEVGDRVLVAGGGLVGCETALFLAQQGRKVVIIEMLDEAGMGLNKANRVALLELLADHQVQTKTGSKLKEVGNGLVTVIDKNLQRQEIGADTVVLSLGFRARGEVVNKLQGLAPEVHVIGDCLSPRKLIDAIHDGFNVAVEI